MGMEASVATELPCLPPPELSRALGSKAGEDRMCELAPPPPSVSYLSMTNNSGINAYIGRGVVSACWYKADALLSCGL